MAISLYPAKSQYSQSPIANGKRRHCSGLSQSTPASVQGLTIAEKRRSASRHLRASPSTMRSAARRRSIDPAGSGFSEWRVVIGPERNVGKKVERSSNCRAPTASPSAVASMTTPINRRTRKERPSGIGHDIGACAQTLLSSGTSRSSTRASSSTPIIATLGILSRTSGRNSAQVASASATQTTSANGCCQAMNTQEIAIRSHSRRSPDTRDQRSRARAASAATSNSIAIGDRSGQLAQVALPAGRAGDLAARRLQQPHVREQAQVVDRAIEARGH